MAGRSAKYVPLPQGNASDDELNSSPSAPLGAAKTAPAARRVLRCALAALLAAAAVLLTWTSLRLAAQHAKPLSSSSSSISSHASGTQSAGPSGPTARIQLPREAKPTRYELLLHPDLESFTFSAVVSIHITALKPANTLTLNAVGLDILEATLARPGNASTGEMHNVECDSMKADEDAQSVALSFPGEPFVVGESMVLTVRYTGEISDSMVGFYRSSYKVGDEKKYLAVTQFEAVHCRSAVPSFDEPDMKAVFKVTIVAKKNLTCLSNTDLVAVSEFAEDPSCSVNEFADTPLMSTYLLAFAIGEFEYLERNVAISKNGPNVRCRIYTLPGDQQRGKFALDVTAKTLVLFSELFGIPYPLSKCDQIAIPDFSAGAMENWGLITYPTAGLLIDDNVGSIKNKMEIATTVTHELAHQWFGNLVTFKYWDELWLNEGFATWVGTYGAAQLFPQWDMWAMFISDDVTEALTADGVRSSHPIHVPVSGPGDISQIFNAISYSKGASVINMLANWLGHDKFFAGLRNYLAAHQYANADANDLWNALSAVSGCDVSKFMDNWIQRVGYPVIAVSQSHDDVTGKTMVKLEQHRFLMSGDVTASDDETIWSIPLDFVPIETSLSGKVFLESSDSAESTPPQHPSPVKPAARADSRITLTDDRIFENSQPTLQSDLVADFANSISSLEAYNSSLASGIMSNIFDKRESVIELPGKAKAFMLNSQRSSFCRVVYDKETLDLIAEAMADESSDLSLAARMGVYSDAFALARSGATSVTGFLSLVRAAMHRESAYSLIFDVAGALETVSQVWAGESDSVCDGLKALQRKVFTPLAQRLGFERRASDTDLDRSLRPLVISQAAMAGEPQLLERAISLFKSITSDDNLDNHAVPSDMYRCIFAVAVAHGNDDSFYHLAKTIFEKESRKLAPDADLMYAALSSLGKACTPALIRDALEYSLSPHVRPQDIRHVWASLGSNSKARRPMFEYLVSNYEDIRKLFKKNYPAIGLCVEFASKKFTTQEDLNMISTFFASKDQTGWDHRAKETLETVKSNIAWISRDSAALEAWIKENV